MKPTIELHEAALSLAIRAGKIESDDRESWPLESARITNATYVLSSPASKAAVRLEIDLVTRNARKAAIPNANEIFPLPPAISRQLAAAPRVSKPVIPAGASLALAGLVMIFIGIYDMGIRAASETSLIAVNINSRGRQNIGIGLSLLALSSTFVTLQATIREAQRDDKDSSQ
jgi:hypothetical protein